MEAENSVQVEAARSSLFDRSKWLINDFNWWFTVNVKHRLIRFIGGVPADYSGGYIQHAKRELPGCNPDADEMDQLMAEQVIQLLAVFATHGHSGFSAPFAISIFSKLARYEPLGPLTGEDSEWMQVGEGEYLCWQNIRAGHVFKGADGRAYDINGKVFREPDGCCYTSGESRVFVEFPYSPVTEYVDVEAV